MLNFNPQSRDNEIGPLSRFDKFIMYYLGMLAYQTNSCSNAVIEKHITKDFFHIVL